MDNTNQVYVVTFSYTNYYDYYNEAYSKVAKTQEKAIQIMSKMLEEEQEAWLNERLANEEVYRGKLEIRPTAISYTDSGIELFIGIEETEIE